MLPQDAFGQGVYGQPGLKVCGCHPKGLDKGHYISEFCNEERLMNLLGNIGEAIIVHRCNDNRSINQKWLSKATMLYVDHEDAVLYTAVGTGFKSTKVQHPRLYNPFDTQNDIIWIDDEENKVIRHDLNGKVGSYAALQIKASTNEASCTCVGRK